MISLALRSALSDRAGEGKVVVVDSWGWDKPSTKAAVKALAGLGVEGRVLVVVGRDDAAAALSFRNLPEVQLIAPAELNAYDVLCNDWIVFTQDVLPTFEGKAKHAALPPTRTPRSKRESRDEAADEKLESTSVRRPGEDESADTSAPVRGRFARRAARRCPTRGFPHQGQRLLDALPPAGHLVLRPHDRRGLVRHSGRRRGGRFRPPRVAAG